jgi:hypothetical protein
VSGAPDYAEPVVGWRVWLAREDQGKTRLRSLFHDRCWPVREPLAAECLRRQLPLRRRDHPAPAASCQCGIYAASLARVGSYLEPGWKGERGDPVVGRVSLWGRVVECEQGWRASLAYPERLYVPILDTKGHEPRAARVALDLTDYGVPVELLELDVAGDITAELTAAAAAAAA